MSGRRRRCLLAGVLALALACAGKAQVGGAETARAGAADLDQLRAAAVAAIEKARAAALGDVARTVSLPSIERLVEDADARRAHVTSAERDIAFVRRTLETARAYAQKLAAGDDPYRTAKGFMVKAYRADWDGTLQPYALAVPRDYDGRRAWPLVVALHGAFSDHRHNLRRVFGLENRRGETDAEASRNELPLPDVPALVVSPYGRGELMGYDGLGGDDVMRVLADVRRAYNVDPDRISLTGLSMGGGGTWSIGLRHPELFAALAPVCGVADLNRLVTPADTALYDLAALAAASPPALAENAAGLQIYIFHGADDPVVPAADSRKMVERFRALGWLGKSVQYTEYAGVKHDAWVPAYKDAELLRKLAAVARKPPRAPAKTVPPPDQPIPGLFGKSVPRERPHIYVYGTHGAPEDVRAARQLAEALANWGPMVGAKFVVKADTEVTAEDRARFSLVLVGLPPLNAIADGMRMSPAGLKALQRGVLAADGGFRAIARDPAADDRPVLWFGALKAAGFERLRRFAHPNRDHPAPENNLDFVAFPALSP